MDRTAPAPLLERMRFALWAKRTHATIASVEAPKGIPRVHASGPDPDRILLFGSDILVGRGVLSHEVGFPGFLARSIARQTHRGVDIVIEAHATLRLSEAIEAARLLELDRYDAVIIDIGLTDALAGTSPASWAQQLQTLLGIFTAAVPASAMVYLIASPDPTIVDVLHSSQGPKVLRTFDAFNDRSREVISGFHKGAFIESPLHSEKQSGRNRTARAFESSAETISPLLIAHLESESARVDLRADPVLSEERRQASVDQLGILDTAPEARFDTIVASAKRLFGTRYAALNVLDHDRRWSKSFRGPASVEGLRETEFCNTTIHTHSGLFVGDTAADPRFRDHPFVTGDPHVRFYAGYPIEAPDGQRIGALCVYDIQPRTVGRHEEQMLRDLALEIERELWNMPSAEVR